MPARAESELAAVEDLFEHARRLEGENRRRYLARSDATTAIRRRVEKLLDADSRAGDFLAHGVLQDVFGEPESLAPGATLGGLELIRQLGAGGAGSVWLAIQRGRHYERRVAVKCLRPPVAMSEERLATEVRILAGLDHANIVRLYDSGVTEGGTHFLVMEYVEGETLIDHCQRLRLGLEERLELLARVCDAVHYAHGRSVIHRDVKPSNVLVTSAGEPKLLDFGIARWLRPEAAPGKLMETLPWQIRLTPAYASPEQLRGERLGPASDIFTLGVVAYELVCGRRPFETDAEPGDVGTGDRSPEKGPLEAALESSGVAPSRCGPLRDSILSALAPRPVARPPSARALAEQLRAGGRPDEPEDSKPALRGWRQATIAAGLALGLLAAFWLGERFARRPAGDLESRVLEPQAAGEAGEAPTVAEPAALTRCRSRATPGPDGIENLGGLTRCLLTAGRQDLAGELLSARYAAMDETTDVYERIRTIRAVVKFHQSIGQPERAQPYLEEIRGLKTSSVGAR